VGAFALKYTLERHGSPLELGAGDPLGLPPGLLVGAAPPTLGAQAGLSEISLPLASRCQRWVQWSAPFDQP